MPVEHYRNEVVLEPDRASAECSDPLSVFEHDHNAVMVAF